MSSSSEQPTGKSEEQPSETLAPPQLGEPSEAFKLRRVLSRVQAGHASAEELRAAIKDLEALLESGHQLDPEVLASIAALMRKAKKVLKDLDNDSDNDGGGSCEP